MIFRWFLKTLFLKFLKNLLLIMGSIPPNCTILYSWVLDVFTLADEIFTKVLRTIETCLSVNNNFYGKLVSSLKSPITFDESFKNTSVQFFIPHFNLLRCELDNFTFKLLHRVILYFYIDNTLKQNKFTVVSW